MTIGDLLIGAQVTVRETVPAGYRALSETQVTVVRPGGSLLFVNPGDLPDSDQTPADATATAAAATETAGASETSAAATETAVASETAAVGTGTAVASETAAAGEPTATAEETVAGVDDQTPTATRDDAVGGENDPGDTDDGESDDDLAGVTELPNTGSSGSERGTSGALALLATLAMTVLAGSLALRRRRANVIDRKA